MLPDACRDNAENGFTSSGSAGCENHVNAMKKFFHGEVFHGKAFHGKAFHEKKHFMGKAFHGEVFHGKKPFMESIS